MNPTLGTIGTLELVYPFVLITIEIMISNWYRIFNFFSKKFPHRSLHHRLRFHLPITLMFNTPAPPIADRHDRENSGIPILRVIWLQLGRKALRVSFFTAIAHVETVRV